LSRAGGKKKKKPPAIFSSEKEDEDDDEEDGDVVGLISIEGMRYACGVTSRATASQRKALFLLLLGRHLEHKSAKR